MARDALFHASNWIGALLVTYSVLFIGCAAVYLCDALLALVSLSTPIPPTVSTVFRIAACLPLLPLGSGLLGYYVDLYLSSRGEITAYVSPAAVFAPYTTPRRAIRAWVLTAATLLLCALIPLSALPILTALSPLFDGSATTLTAAILTFVGLLALLAALYINARLTPILYLCVTRPHLSVGDAVRRVWCRSADFALNGVLLQLGLLLAAVLSALLTAGILLVLYVLPISVFTYTAFCHELSRRCDLAADVH